MSDENLRATASKKLGVKSTDGNLSLDGKSLLEGMGGKLGITETILPSVLFGASFALTGQAIVSVSLAAGTSALFILYRLITRKSASSALIGAIAVGFASWLALRDGGEAVDYFVPGFITNAVYGSLLLISILVRWPIIGVLVEILRGNAASWRKDRKKVTIYSLVTAMWVGFFSLRLAVQVPLYLAGSAELLATARVAMGPPLYALVILATWLILRATVLRTR
jgi:intracellular septation protein A